MVDIAGPSQRKLGFSPDDAEKELETISVTDPPGCNPAGPRPLPISPSLLHSAVEAIDWLVCVVQRVHKFHV